MRYIEPKVFEKSFTCPHCGTIAKQDWWQSAWDGSKYIDPEMTPIRVGLCQHCNENSLWIGETMYYPDHCNAPFPNQEMPQNVRRLYEEASSIHYKSPRGAAALLRLAIQVLCVIVTS